ncbi:MAG: lysophospholipid acyltransferase family protein [Dehalococcoidia bacterium]
MTQPDNRKAKSNGPALRQGVAFFNRLVGLLIEAYMWVRSDRIVVRGRENLPSQPGYILVANHVSYADPMILWRWVNPAIRFWMKTDILFPFVDPILAFFSRILFGVILVQRDKPDLRRMIRESKSALLHDWVGVFPEGTRSRGNRPVLQAGFGGVAVLARRTGAPLIPVGLHGTSGVANPFSLRRHRVTVSIGKPFVLSEKAGREEDVKRILGAIADVLPESLRGDPASRRAR